MRIKFDKHPVGVEEDNYAIKIVNASVVYKSDTSAYSLLKNFKLKNCLFVATNIVKNNDKKVSL